MAGALCRLPSLLKGLAYMLWQTSRFRIDLTVPKVMGIVNATPDSFSGGGTAVTSDAARALCDQLVREGADILDLGAESTRPGATPVSAEDELARLLPVLKHAVTLGVPVSVDTYKPSVMQAALDAGADIINDVWALRWREYESGTSGVQVVKEHPSCGVCLMHMHRDPQTMQIAPMAEDVVPAVTEFLRAQATQLESLGVASSRICVDPGVGFGKTVSQNFALLAHQSAFLALGYPVLAGWSRKSSLGAVVRSAGANDPKARLAASIAAAVLAVHHGAKIVRVHDVKETVDALLVHAAMQAAAGQSPL